MVDCVGWLRVDVCWLMCNFRTKKRRAGKGRGLSEGAVLSTGDTGAGESRIFRAGEPADDEVCVLCIGDSLTRGFQGTYALPARPYAAALSQLLGPGFALDERGVDGDVDVLARDVGDGVVDGAVLRRQLLHRRDHRLGGLDLVRAGALADL